MDLKNTINNLDKTLARRRQMSANVEHALRKSPKEMSELLHTLSKLYYSGKIDRFWDVLANLAGAERGYGNDWFFSALEMQKKIEEGEL